MRPPLKDKLQTLCVTLELLFHHTKNFGGEVGLKVGEGGGWGGGGVQQWWELITSSIIVGSGGGEAMSPALFYFINILPVVIVNVFFVSQLPGCKYMKRSDHSATVLSSTPTSVEILEFGGRANDTYGTGAISATMYSYSVSCCYCCD